MLTEDLEASGRMNAIHKFTDPSTAKKKKKKKKKEPGIAENPEIIFSFADSG